MISMRTLGPLEVSVDGRPAPPQVYWSHNVALLLYLARAPAHRCTREHAVGLLWPDKPQAAAKQSLREAVHTLRRCLGAASLRAAGDQLELVAGAVELDTDKLDHFIKRNDWAAATPLVGGQFAQGFVLENASAFEDWLRSEQWHWQGRSMDALITHAEQRLDAGDLLGADEPLRRAWNLDPRSERALRTQIRRLALAGGRLAALALYEQFIERAEEPGEALEGETKALAARVRSQREWTLPPSITVPRVPLFGRERELAEILRHWKGVRAKRLALVMIEAPAGHGKTRLTEEVVTRASLDGGACIMARAVPADRQQSMSGIVALTRGGLLDAAGIAAASPGALSAISHEASEWAERFPAAAKTSAAKPLGVAFSEVLKEASREQPLLLVLDDAQWLDDASLEVVEMLVRDLKTAPILIVLAASPEPATPKWSELLAAIGRDAPGAITRLSAFDKPTVAAMIRWFFPKYTEDQIDRLSRRVTADSAGIPLFALEICHAITQGLDVTSKQGIWPSPLRTLDQTRPGDLPDTIVAAIRVGFNALSPNATTALKAAAVLGDRVTAKRIARATGLDGPPLHAALDELEWRRWLLADSRGYSFVARIVREVVERDMVLHGEQQRFLKAGS